MAPADDRHTVPQVLKLGRLHLFGQQRPRITIRALAAFFQNHIAFRQNIRLGQTQIAHTVCLQLHHQGQPVGGNMLKISGIIPGRKRVVVATLRLDDRRQFAGAHVIGALEHQMFQKMRNAGFAGHLICGPCAVPHHVGHNRRAVVFDHHNVQPVFKLE